MEIPVLSQLLWPTIIFFIALSLRAVFAFLETSITSMRLFKLKELSRTTKRYQTLFSALEKNPHRVMVCILIANSIADVTSAALATYIMEEVFKYFNLSGGLGFSFGIALASITIVLFGEIVPKNLARDRGEAIFQSMLWLTNFVYRMLNPLSRVLLRLSNLLTAPLADKQTEPLPTSEREIRFLIGYIQDKGLMEPEKSEMLHNIFELGHTPVRDIMVPATDIVLVDVNTPLEEVIKAFFQHRYTRLPVYEDNKENIIGMVHQKDLFWMLSQQETKSLRELLRPIMFIPEMVKVNQLLREFQQQQMHIAIVLNEHGSVIGLITLEDVLEEIVGEISDEHEFAAQKIIPLQQGGWLVDATIPLEDLGKYFDINFETESSVTLAGFLMELLQHLPKKGERTNYKDFYFQIQKATPKRISKVLMFEKKQPEQMSIEQTTDQPFDKE